MTKEERIEKYVDETEEKLIKTKLEIEAEEYEQKQGYKGLLDALYEEGQNKGYECVRSYITPYIVRAYIESAMVREKRIAELIALINAERERQEKCDDVHLRTIADLEKENSELKADNDARKFAMAMSEKVEKQLREENSKLKDVLEGYKKIAKWCDKCDKIAELKSENQKWKDEWQEQVQKATDEGYARTLQTMRLTKAKQFIRDFLSVAIDYIDPIDKNYSLIEEAEQFLKDSDGK